MAEHDLRTHDLALPLSPSSSSGGARQLRVLLLSPSNISDNNSPTTLKRIHRFASLTGGRDLAIVFLLYPGDETTQDASTAGMVAYAKLQAEMMNLVELLSIPILPLPKLDGLSNILKSHRGALMAPRPYQKAPRATTFDLLRDCSINPPLGQSEAFILTDLFPGLQSLAKACTTTQQATGAAGSFSLEDLSPTNKTTPADNSASDRLESFRNLQGEAAYSDLVEFWNVEYAA